MLPFSGADDIKPNSADTWHDMPPIGSAEESAPRASARMNRPLKRAMFNSNHSVISNNSLPTEERRRPGSDLPRRPHTQGCARRECLCGLPPPGDYSEEDIKKNRRKNMRVVLLCKKNSCSRVSIHAKRYTRSMKSISHTFRTSLPATAPTEPRRKGTGYLNRGVSSAGRDLKPKLALIRMRNALKADDDDTTDESDESEEEELKLPPAGAGGDGKRETRTRRSSLQHGIHFPKLPDESDTAGQHLHDELKSSNSPDHEDEVELDSPYQSRFTSLSNNYFGPCPTNAEPSATNTVLSTAVGTAAGTAAGTAVGSLAGTARHTLADNKIKFDGLSGLGQLSETVEENEALFMPDFSFAQAWNKRHALKRRSCASHLSKMPLGARMNRLEDLRQIRQRERAQERRNELKRQKFGNLPPSESAAFTRAFTHFDVDCDGYLDRDEAIQCLKELGIWGVTSRERNELLDMCTEASSWITKTEINEDEQVHGQLSTHISLLDFALSVVPRARQKLIDMRSTAMLQEFFKFDDDENGHLSKRECAEVARCMGIDQRTMNANHQKPTSPNGYDDHSIDFETFQVMIAKGKESLDRSVRQRERSVQRAHNLSDDLFNDLREDIMSMHQLFLNYDADDSGSLSETEVHLMLKELGLLPKSLKDREEVSQILTASDVDGSGEANFAEFLEMVKKIRELWISKKRHEHLQHAEKYDRDKRGMISVNDFPSILAELGLVPNNRREQEELAKTIKSMDQEGGYITFEQFQHFAQRVNEGLKIFRYEEELDYAVRLGFTEKQMRDLHFVFDSLDVDGSGKLDLTEVRNAFTMVRKHPAPEALEASFKALDTDHSGELEFKEFLALMQLMRDGDGIFADEQQKLTVKVKSLDCRVLRRCLDYFKLSREYLNSLNKEELVLLFCDYVGVSENANLQEVLGTNTIGELYRCIELKGEALELGLP